MESNVGVGDILRLFFENEHALYRVSAINYDNEVMIKGRDGVEELLPTDKGKLSELDGRAIVGFQVVRPKTQAYPKGSEIVLNLHNGKSYRGTVQVNDDGILEIMVVDYPTPVFVDVYSPHPMVKSVGFYTDSEAAESDATELPENPETELLDLRSKIKQTNPAEAARRTQAFKELRADYTDSASGVVVRPLPLLSATNLPRWIFPVLRHYRKALLPDAAAQTQFLAELGAATQQPQYYSYYEAVFQALAPFTSSGNPVKERTHAVSFRQKTVRATVPVYFEVLVPQVTKEGSDLFESGEFVLLPEALPMSRVYLPGTPLYQRCLMHANLGGFHKFLRKKAGKADVVHSLPTVPQKATVFPTAYDTFLSLETYLCYLRDVPNEVFERLRPAISEKVARLKERKARTTTSPSSAATHIFPDKYGDRIPPAFSSEMLANMLALDQGRRLLNKPVPEKAKKARIPENSGLEVLPEKVVDLFNAWIAETSSANAAKIVALVDTFAREPTKGEDPHWLYMNGEMLKNKFVPVVVERMARAYHHKGITGFLAALEQLKPSARIAQEGHLLVDKASGFAVAPVDLVVQTRGAVVEVDTPKLAYTQSDLNILSVVKIVAAPYALKDRYDYILQHVRGSDRPEDVVYSVGAYVSLFADVEVEEVARAVAESLAKMYRYHGIYWQAVKAIGPGALLSKMAEKKKYLARDYEFLRMSRMAERQSGHEWPSFQPMQRPPVSKEPLTVPDKLNLYPLKLIPYFRRGQNEESKEVADQLQFLEGARPATRATVTMARPEPPAPKVAVARYEDEVEEAIPTAGPLDPKRYEAAAETVWHCSHDGKPPPDYVASLLDNWQSDVKLEPLLLEFVQNTALTYPTLISRGRTHFAAHAGLSVQGDRMVAQHLGKKARTFLEKKLNEYYSPLFALSASKSAQDYYKRKAQGEPLGENELSDNDAETAFVRAYEVREEAFRALVKEAQTADLAGLKVIATEALALHLSVPPLDYECAFVGACVKMFRADLNSVKTLRNS